MAVVIILIETNLMNFMLLKIKRRVNQILQKTLNTLSKL